jgi:uncharacterized membrane protein SpoIIM required for sporulation
MIGVVAAEATMDEVRFEQTRRAAWQELEQRLALSDRKARHDADHALQLSRLYRQVCSDLAAARARGYSVGLVDRLSVLSASAHNRFYRQNRTSAFSLRSMITVFPRTVRKHRRLMLLAAGLFVVPFALAIAQPFVMPTVVPFWVSAETLVETASHWEFAARRTNSENALMTGFYVFNNVGIAFRCFAAGVIVGLGPAWVLVSNGLQIGSVFGYVAAAGNLRNLLTFVVTHGALELTAIVIAGGGGLLLGRELLVRRQVRRAGAQTETVLADLTVLVLGAGVMLGAAALIEGWFSPAYLPDMVKWVAGSALWLLVMVWLLFSGRKR